MSAMAKSAEAVVPFATEKRFIPMATRFRSTWLTSSLRALRERGLFDAYLGHLPRQYHASVLDSVAGVWLDVAIAVAHYEACDALGLGASEQFDIGRTVTTFAHRTSYSLALRLATEVGVTPWACFTIQQRLWSQVWVGGAVGTFKLGPKEVRVEIAGWPCSRIPYCRIAMRGLLLGQTELFCSKAYVRELPGLCSATSLGYRVAWA
jgi:hypothetical protein